MGIIYSYAPPTNRWGNDVVLLQTGQKGWRPTALRGRDKGGEPCYWPSEWPGENFQAGVQGPERVDGGPEGLGRRRQGECAAPGTCGLPWILSAERWCVRQAPKARGAPPGLGDSRTSGHLTAAGAIPWHGSQEVQGVSVPGGGSIPALAPPSSRDCPASASGCPSSASGGSLPCRHRPEARGLGPPQL